MQKEWAHNAITVVRNIGKYSLQRRLRKAGLLNITFLDYFLEMIYLG